MPTDFDINISGQSCSIDCRCSRWDVSNYNIILESWLIKSQLQDLRNSIRPGATKELFRILGRPNYRDVSWTGANTLAFTPASNSASNLKNMRDGTTVGFVKSINTVPVKSDKGWILTKIELNISGSSSL